MSFTGTYIGMFAENGSSAFQEFQVNYVQNVLLGSGLTAGLSTEGTVPMSFTGTYIGMFAENGSSAFQEFQVNYVLPDE